MLIGFIIVAYRHRTIIGKGINIVSQYPLYGNHGFSSLHIPPILSNLNYGGLCFVPFLHTHNKQEHTQYLKLSTSSKYGEILLLLQLALIGFLDLQLCPAMRASTSFSLFVYYPTMPTIHTSGATFWQAVGKVVYALTECPLVLCFGYWAKMLALFQNCLLKFVSRFHSLKNRIVMVVLGLLCSRSFSLVRYGSVSWQVPPADIA